MDAGDDQAILLGTSAALVGTVFDDGLPNAIVTAEWLVDSGPGGVTFADPFAVVVDRAAQIRAERGHERGAYQGHAAFLRGAHVLGSELRRGHRRRRVG